MAERNSFTEESLAAEKGRVIDECAFTAKSFATHKFATAAWNQGFRHGKIHVELIGDVKRASLSDVQQLRDIRLAVSKQVTVAIVGNLKTKEIVAEAERQLGALRMTGRPAASTGAKPKNMALTWDLEARHILLTWSIPDLRHEDYAELMASAQALNMLCLTDSQLTKKTGMVLAGADLSTPEGNFFYLSASLRPDADFESVQAALLGKMSKLPDSAPVQHVRFLAQSLSKQMNEVPAFAQIKAMAPEHVTMAQIEGNWGIQMGMNEHRFGELRLKLAKELSAISAADLKASIQKYLSAEKAFVCKLQSKRP